MGLGYKAVLWNRQKKRYDLIMGGFILLYLLAYTGLNLVFYPEVIPQTLVVRATATLALLLLHVILVIGPLARLNEYFLPLLYNRRHLGVTMFFLAAFHGVFSIFWFHGSGNVNPLYSLFISNPDYDSFINFPYQTLGFFALLILFLMASSSHDFWLHNLSPQVWKALHMFVYLAYALVMMHVMLGAFQAEASLSGVGLMAAGLVLVVGVHVYAGFKEVKGERIPSVSPVDGWFKVGNIEDIPENCARIVSLPKERVAIFKYDDKLSAVSNVCKHQMGPLGEGKIVDGCITCPWHGYQYFLHNGTSPPPFTEKIATYELRLEGNTVFINPQAKPEGTALEPVKIPNISSRV